MKQLKRLNATVADTGESVEQQMASQTQEVVSEIGNLSVTLGGIYDMASGDEVKYVPMEDFVTEKLLADAQSDFDNSELVFEWEL